MKVIAAQFLIAVLLFSCLADSVRGQPQPFPPVVGVRVEYGADLGASGYGVQLSGLSALTDVILRAPDGTVFKADSTSPQALTLNEITSRFAGEWTFLDSSQVSPNGELQATPYVISSADLTTFPTSTPQILSPPDGARVPAKFSFQATGNNVSLRGDGLFASVSGLSEFDLRSLPQLPRTVEARASTSKNNRFELITLSGSPARDVRIYVQMANLSPPMIWTVGVPEPSTIILTVAAISAFAAFRRITASQAERDTNGPNQDLQVIQQGTL